MAKYDWAGFTPAEKKEITDLIDNEKASLYWQQNQLKTVNRYNSFYQTWTHDEARKKIKNIVAKIRLIEKDYGLVRVK